MTPYQQGFLTRCAARNIPAPLAQSMLKQAEADPELQRATAIFQDWLTTRKHTVRRGETLSGIAKRNNIPLQDLMEENGMQSVTAIKPGQQLRIPVAGAKRKGAKNDKV